MTMDDQEFRKVSGEALLSLQRALERASDDFDFDVDNKEGALSIEFGDPPAKFVISPNSPVRQVWVSARVKSFKLDWDDSLLAFVLAADGRTLLQLISDVVSEQMGETVLLSDTR